jgi:multidrug efflux pump subunit AcrB
VLSNRFWYSPVPYGAVGALLALLVLGTPFGFMAFPGIASLIGIIVSDVIVLFDFIEEVHEKRPSACSAPWRGGTPIRVIHDSRVGGH